MYQQFQLKILHLETSIFTSNVVKHFKMNF